MAPHYAVNKVGSPSCGLHGLAPGSLLDAVVPRSLRLTQRGHTAGPLRVLFSLRRTQHTAPCSFLLCFPIRITAKATRPPSTLP